MALISRSSLGSNWVRYELNSGMIEEIESGSVKVIPVLGPGVTSENLPNDLRAKYYLDLRTGKGAAAAVDELVRLVKPHERLRKERLDQLRLPATDTASLEARKKALWSSDKTTALAALRGLELTGGVVAVAAIAEFAFNTWHMSVLERCFRALRRRHADGGILALTASLLTDPRYFVPKLRLVHDFLDKHGAGGSDELAAYIESQTASHDRFPTRVAEPIQVLGRSDQDDVRYGSVLCRLVRPSWGGAVPAPDQDDVVGSTNYANSRLPGLSSMAAKSAWTAS
jgi:hypothetical protein